MKTDKETFAQLSGKACIEQGFVLGNSLARFDGIKFPELYSVVLLEILIA